MSKKGGVLTTGLLLVACMLTPIASAHEQKTLTVIMSEQGVVSGNITDPAFVQGNAIWFQMHDDTENTTMSVRLDTNLNGVFDAGEDFESGPLVHECEMDENGSLVDEDCAVSTTFAFDLNATVATYLFWVHHDNNGTESIWNHSVTVHKDVHEEEGPTPGDCFGIGCAVEEASQEDQASENEVNENSLVVLLLLLSLIGGIALALSIFKERSMLKTEKTYLNEE